MKRALVMAFAGCFFLNCAALRGAASGNMAAVAAAAEEAARKLKKAKEDADRDCEPLNAKVGKGKDVADTDDARAKAAEEAYNKGFGVSWNEERAIGGAIAIGFGKSGKGLFVDITDKDPAALQKKAAGDRKKVKLSAGDKNDLNLYVQTVGNHL